MRRRFLKWAGIAVASIFGLLIAAAVLTREGRFLTRAAWEEARILMARQPIPEAAADSSLPEEVRQQLRVVLDVRDFADTALGLSAGGSYTTFAQIDRDTLLLVLSASPRTELKFYTWWYPIAGTIPYKGFFDFEAARSAEQKLAARGYDTHLRTAGAFSTLGWFEDPLLSTALGRDARRTASTVIHELAHNTLYVPGNSLFNESFASFVGYFGAGEYFLSQGDSASARWLMAVWHDERVLEVFYASLRDSAQVIYDRAVPDSIKLLQREELFDRAREALRTDVQDSLQLYSGEALASRAMNNATLIAAGIYRDRLGLFEQVLEHFEGALRATVEAIVNRVTDSDGDPYDALEAILNQPSVVAP